VLILDLNVAECLLGIILRALPITKFYDTPHPLPAGKAGELIRSQSFEQYELPFSVDVVRILYHSCSAAGEYVASSGIVLIPSAGKLPAGGWRSSRGLTVPPASRVPVLPR
jgi:hypothetical protein